MEVSPQSAEEGGAARWREPRAHHKGLCVCYAKEVEIEPTCELNDTVSGKALTTL